MQYLFVFVGTLIVNFFTLWFVVRKSMGGVKVLLTNPAFLIGDFFCLPLYFVLTSIFLTDNASLLQTLNPAHFLIIVVISGLVTFAFGKKFNLLRKVWIPHGILHWGSVSILLLTVLLTAFNSWEDSLLVVTMIGLLFIHQLLGFLYPKKLSDML